MFTVCSDVTHSKIKTQLYFITSKFTPELNAYREADKNELEFYNGKNDSDSDYTRNPTSWD
ncbi:MAG: hypothetical protein IJS90_01325 [Clostridia bacterium]|nr:hypothetical protein [Clostridia bacterium]